METLRHMEKKNNLIMIPKPKLQTWRAHVMKYYDTFKLAPNIHPTFDHYAKYVKCPLQSLMIITPADTIYQMFTAHKALCQEFCEYSFNHLIP